MITMLQKITFLVLVISSFSCTEPEQVAMAEYYDLNTFLENQIEQLQQTAVGYNKIAVMNGETNELPDFKPDWKRELELFISTDLNKSAYVGAYKEVKLPSSVSYELMEGFDHPVKSLIIELENEQPIAIKAEMITENFLYSSERNMEASFANGLLSTYHIHGTQSLFIGSEKEFDIRVVRE